MTTFAVSTAVQVLYVVAGFAVLLGIPLTVTLLKGQYLLAAAGLMAGGLVWMITAFRLARPSSFWARRVYGEAKRARSVGRYGEPRPRRASR